MLPADSKVLVIRITGSANGVSGILLPPNFKEITGAISPEAARQPTRNNGGYGSARPLLGARKSSFGFQGPRRTPKASARVLLGSGKAYLGARNVLLGSKSVLLRSRKALAEASERFWAPGTLFWVPEERVLADAFGASLGTEEPWRNLSRGGGITSGGVVSSKPSHPPTDLTPIIFYSLGASPQGVRLLSLEPLRTFSGPLRMLPEHCLGSASPLVHQRPGPARRCQPLVVDAFQWQVRLLAHALIRTSVAWCFAGAVRKI